jgi:hypothetical protein
MRGQHTSVRLLVGALVMLVAAAGFALGPASPAHAGTCTRQSIPTIKDPNTGWAWAVRWVCGNRPGALMYGNADVNTATAVMDSGRSWFLCWRRGQMHAGGNNVWYYSLGDRAISSPVDRQKWGYMPAVDVYTDTDPWAGMPQCPVGQSPPARTDGVKKVLFVHGYDSGGSINCAETWDTALNHFAANGWSPSQLIKVQYYARDFNCHESVKFPGTGGFSQDNAIEDIAQAFAWYVYNRFSRYGESVDVVAHSMGGLVTRAAIAGWRNKISSRSWPPYLYIEDVVTLATPHAGAYEWGPCIGPLANMQCRQMAPGDGFIRGWIQAYGNPQSSVSTDWTLVASGADGVVTSSSALDTFATVRMGHKVLFHSNSGIGHSDITKRTSGSLERWYCDHYNPCQMNPGLGEWATWNHDLGVGPVPVAAGAVRYQTGR